MSETPNEPALTIRYVAGFGMNPTTERIEGHIVQLYEDAEGGRHGNLFIASGMDRQQVEHLHMQLGNLLAIMGPEPTPKERTNG